MPFKLLRLAVLLKTCMVKLHVAVASVVLYLSISEMECLFQM